MGMDGDERKAAKRLRNRRDYAASRSMSDHVLLRLDKGGAASLDEASRHAGLSRSAFARLYLGPLVSAIAPNLHALDEASRFRGQSLAQFFGRAIEAALRKPAEESADGLAAASDFDRLFETED